ncbi:MAG: glycosyltransferase family 2 protein [Flavobacteriales bacterium]|nr:glycosyltransferase family 2 protein [Flavobacteriales bacterium]
MSIVIPCRNEQGFIGRCLSSIEAADLDRDRTLVLICDGRSEDGTRDVVRSFTGRLPWMHLVDNPQRTTPHALNAGLRHAPFDVGIILGAHATIAKDHVTAALAALRGDPEAGCAGGVIQNAYEDDRSRRIGAAMAHPFGVGNAHFRTGKKRGHVDTVAFGAYRKEVFERVGWFDELLVRNQDDEFNYRVTKAGFAILLDPDIRSTYYVRASYRKLFRQYFQYGYWKVYVNRKHGTVTTGRQLVPAIWVAALVLGGMGTLVFGVLLSFWILGVLAYGMASLYSAFRASDRVGDVPGVWWSFVVLHMAYGLGYWKGIVDHLVLRRKTDPKYTASSR